MMSKTPKKPMPPALLASFKKAKPLPKRGQRTATFKANAAKKK